MRILDYLRLGFAGIVAHKKRAFLVIIIVGLLFSVIADGSFILQGLENTTMAKMLAPTNGEVVLMSAVDMEVCGEDCDTEAEVSKIKRNIKKYGGEIIETEIVQMAEGTFYKLDEDLFGEPNQKIADDVSQVVLPLNMAAKIAGVKIPERDESVEEKLKTIEIVRQKVLQKVIESQFQTSAEALGKPGEADKPKRKYYTLEILPSGTFANNLSFSNIHQSGNPLDLIFSQIRTGASQNFMIKTAEIKDENEPVETAPEENLNTENNGIVFAKFPDIKTAFKYYKDKVNYCSENDQIFTRCSQDYKYKITAAISNPITTYENFQNIWLIFKITAIILTVIASIIALSTYSRLIGKDTKIISLYYALGATKRQTKLIYLTYLTILSLAAIGFSIFIGFLLAVIYSATSKAALTDLFTLGFGIASEEIWLIGWSNLIWIPVGGVMLAAILAMILGRGNFSTKNLTRKMK